MKPDPLDDLLRAYASQPTPAPASAGKAEVWREIDSRKRGHDWLGLRAISSWRDIFAEPRLAVAGLALALVTGVAPVAAAAAAMDAPQKARASLHFECFTSCPSCLAGTMKPEDMRQ
jgi:hypothetical protein